MTILRLMLVSLIAWLAVVQLTAVAQAVEVELKSADAKTRTISILYEGKEHKLAVAPDAEIVVEGKKAEITSLLPGDKISVVYDNEDRLVTSIARKGFAPAEKPADGSWDEIDKRLIFLMVRLANLEASLDAVEEAIRKSLGKRSDTRRRINRANKGNELMDRKGGGPMKWSEFYGRTAEKFFYHPTDWNTTYHTRTILTPQSPQDDNQTGPGVPSRQGLPVHQRPPQFDYIYRANENAKARAEIEAAELKGKMDALVERRVRLEAEQAALWTEIAFRVVSRYDLDKKPLYRFEPLLADGTTEARHQAEKIKNAASFMRLALSIIDEAQKSQAGAFSKIKPAVGKARLRLNDNYLRLGVDVSDRKSTEGRFALLAKRLDDVASNLSDSYIVAQEGDRAKDQLRKDTFRGLLQESLVDYAQIILALDEMATEMKHEWKIKPDPDRPIQFVSLASVEAVRPVVKVFNDVGDAAAPKVVAPKPVDLLELVEIPRDVERGVWSRGRQGIAPIKFEEASGISIRYAVPQEYDLEITFKKLQVVRPPVHDINIGVITQNGDFYQVGIRNQQAFTHIFLYPDKKHQNKTKPIPLNKTQRVIFKVRKDSLEMYLNGQLQIKSELPRKTSNGYKFLIETWRTQVLFESMTLTPV